MINTRQRSAGYFNYSNNQAIPIRCYDSRPMRYSNWADWPHCYNYWASSIQNYCLHYFYFNLVAHSNNYFTQSDYYFIASDSSTVLFSQPFAPVPTLKKFYDFIYYHNSPLTRRLKTLLNFINIISLPITTDYDKIGPDKLI